MNDILLKEYQKRFLFYEPHEKQVIFHKYGGTAPFRLLMGGNRIGKTLCASAETCFHLTGNYPQWWEGKRFDRPISAWAVSPVSRMSADLYKKYISPSSGEPPLLHEDYLEGTVPSHKSNFLHLNVRHSSGGISELQFKSCAEGQLAFAGAKKDLIHMDEPPEMTVFSECIMRLTPTNPKDACGILMITATMVATERSPVGVQSLRALVSTFMEKDIVEYSSVGDRLVEERRTEKIPPESVQDNKVYLIVGMDDVPHLTKEAKDMALSSVAERERGVRSTGIPEFYAQLAYPIEDDRITVPPMDIPDSWASICGLDFGWRNTALVVLRQDPDSNVLYVTGEYKQGDIPPQAHVNEWNQRKSLSPAMWAPVMADPAGKQRSQADGRTVFSIFADLGVKVIGANNAKQAGVYTVWQQLQLGKLKIFSTCTELLREKRSYGYNNDNVLVKGDDHLLDALRYAIMGRNNAELLNRSSYYDRYPTSRGVSFGI